MAKKVLICGNCGGSIFGIPAFKGDVPVHTKACPEQEEDIGTGSGDIGDEPPDLSQFGPRDRFCD